MRDPWRRAADRPVRGDDDAHDEPIDLAAVHADDALIDALAVGDLESLADLADPRDPLVGILAAWAQEIAPDRDARERDCRDRIAPDRIALDQIAPDQIAPDQIAPDRPRWRPPLRHLTAAAAAAALLVGVALGAGEAVPGDSLWGVSKVFYAERASSVEAVIQVEARLARARAALIEGRTDTAAHELAGARDQLHGVRDEEGRHELEREREKLTAGLSAGLPPEPVAPTAAPPAGPALAAPAPAAAAAPDSVPPTTTAAPPALGAPPAAAAGSTTAPPSTTEPEPDADPPTGTQRSESDGTAESEGEPEPESSEPTYDSPREAGPEPRLPRLRDLLPSVDNDSGPSAPPANPDPPSSPDPAGEGSPDTEPASAQPDPESSQADTESGQADTESGQADTGVDQDPGQEQDGDGPVLTAVLRLG